jgi:hypothetical protein
MNPHSCSSEASKYSENSPTCEKKNTVTCIGKGQEFSYVVSASHRSHKIVKGYKF